MFRRAFITEPASWPFALLLGLLSCRFSPALPCYRH